KGEFPVAVNAICSAVVQAGEARCGIRIASQGEYTLELQANNAATEVQVQVSYLDIELGDGTMIDGISLREGDFAVLRMPIHQHVPVITISLTGDNGDAALMLDV